jgi:GNAT superfamily N-acetyltransferase
MRISKIFNRKWYETPFSIEIFAKFAPNYIMIMSTPNTPAPASVVITLWEPRYNADFVRLNQQWIERFFKLEPSDLKYFHDPEGEIITPGGQIFIALMEGKAVGCCALVHHPDTDDYELAKMAVDPEAQGAGIGTQLGHALLDYARSHGIHHLYLEANTRLVASVKLYHALGFRPVPIEHAVYDRCDLFMEWSDQ